MRHNSIYSLTVIILIIFSTIAAAQTTGDYRTNSSGVWTNLSVWEKFDGSDWGAVEYPPTSASGVITISDSVYIQSNIQIDQVNVTPAGKLVISDTNFVTILNGAGTDLTLDGEIELHGSLTLNNSTTIDGSGTLTNNDSLSILDGISIACDIINNGTMWLNGTTSFNGAVTTLQNSLIDIVSGANHRYAFISFAKGFTNHGLIRMAGYRDDWGNPIVASITINSDSLLNATDGTIQTIVGHGADRIIVGQVNNYGNIIVDHVLSLNKAHVSHSNHGVITINGSSMTVSGDTTSFTNDSTITITSGAYLEVKNGSTLIPSHGTLSGSVQITNAKLGSGILPATASLTIKNSVSPDSAQVHNYASILIIGYYNVYGFLHTYAGSSIRIESGTHNETGILDLDHGLVNNGTLEMIAFNDGWGNPRTAYIRSDSAIVNSPIGTIVTTKGTGATREIEAPFINRGLINVNYLLMLNKAGASDTNSGVININGLYMQAKGSSSSFVNTGTITMSDTSYLDILDGRLFVPTSGAFSGIVKITNAELGSGTIPLGANLIIRNSTTPADAVINHHGMMHIYGYFTINGVVNTFSESGIYIESGTFNDTGILTLVHGLTNNGIIDMISFLDGWGNPRTAFLRSDSLITNGPGGKIRTYHGAGGGRNIEAPFENQGMMELYYGIAFNKSGVNHINNGEIYLNNGAMDIGSNNTLTNRKFIDCGTKTITGYGNFIHSAGGTLMIGSPQGISASGATGNVIVTGTRMFDTAAYYVYSGATAQVTGNGIPGNVKKVMLQNDSGVTLSKTIVIDTLILSKGVLHTDSRIVAISEQGVVSRDSGWVDGNLQKTFPGTGTALFELGTVNGYSPVTVTVTSGAGEMIAKAVQGVHPNDSGNSLARYWSISASGMTANLSFSYLDDDVIGSDSDYVICKYDTMWTILGGTVNPDSNIASINGVTSFSDWTLRNLNVLPFGLSSFHGGEVGAYRVLLEWSTVKELNNLGFYIERKSGDSDYTVISERIAGAGTSQEEHQYTWIDSTLIDTGAYRYRLKQESSGGGSTYSYAITVNVNGPNAVGDERELPEMFALDQNYPNPFNPSTVIRYSLPVNSQVRLTVCDMLGREVATIVDEMQEAGYKAVEWDASGLASGIYFYRLHAGEFMSVKKLLLLR